MGSKTNGDDTDGQLGEIFFKEDNIDQIGEASKKVKKRGKLKKIDIHKLLILTCFR
jgi:hypothetical protein